MVATSSTPTPREPGRIICGRRPCTSRVYADIRNEIHAYWSSSVMLLVTCETQEELWATESLSPTPTHTHTHLLIHHTTPINTHSTPHSTPHQRGSIIKLHPEDFNWITIIYSNSRGAHSQAGRAPRLHLQKTTISFEQLRRINLSSQPLKEKLEGPSALLT